MSATRHYIGEQNGMLVVVCDDFRYSSPECGRVVWPTTTPVNDMPEEILGLNCSIYEGMVSVEWQPGSSYRYDRRYTLRLVNGGSTKATFLEHLPISRPKTRSKAEWYCGEWRIIHKNRIERRTADFPSKRVSFPPTTGAIDAPSHEGTRRC